MKPVLKPRIYLSIFAIFLFSGCSSKLNSSDDYQDSLYHHATGSPEKALETFPKEEKNTFITTLEQAYLKVLSGNPDNEALHELVDSIDQRIRFEGSREVKSLFYAETAEGYYASEHEIIWLHLLLSWGYSLEREYEKACVEARRASHLLSAPWSHEGHFDDAMLRIFLGGLWTMCGSWEDALVAFRKAFQLSPETKWLEELIDLEEPPANLFIVLGGIGPRPYWNPDAKVNVVRGIRNVSFQGLGNKSSLRLVDMSNNEIPLQLSPDSSNWYQRHIERDNAIHELIVDSNYTAKAAGSVAKESAKMAAGLAAGTGVIIGSVIVGGLVVYIAIHVESLELAGTGALIALGGTMLGLELIAETAKDSFETIKEDLNSANYYRFVRFLPEYLWVGWKNDDIEKAPFSIKGKNHRPFNVQTIRNNNTYVHIAHFPDVDSPESKFKNRVEYWQAWEKDALDYLSDPDKKASWNNLTRYTRYLLTISGDKFFYMSLDIGETSYKITIDKDGIYEYLIDGLFEDGPTFRLDFNKQSLTANKAARELLVNTDPEEWILSIFDSINKEIKTYR